jgi:hypothetical protein
MRANVMFSISKLDERVSATWQGTHGYTPANQPSTAAESSLI